MSKKNLVYFGSKMKMNIGCMSVKPSVLVQDAIFMPDHFQFTLTVW